MRPLPLALALTLFATSVASAESVRVTVSGTVVTNNGVPELAEVVPGDPAWFSFMLDSNDWVPAQLDNTRAYAIDLGTFEFEVGGIDVAVREPEPEHRPSFRVHDDEDIDWISIARSVDLPYDIQLELMGPFFPLEIDWSVNYAGDVFDSIELLDIVGTYDLTGLEFELYRIATQWSTEVLMSYETMTIEIVDAPCDADLNGDGGVDADDLLAIFAGWGNCEECAADLDGDGLVDAADLIALLGAWGDC